MPNNELEDKSGPQKNVEQKTPSASEMVGPRHADTAVADKMKKASFDEKREMERLRVMGVSTDAVSSRGANIRAQGTTHKEPIILPRYNEKESPYEEGVLIVNDLGDTVPALKLRAPQMKAPAPQPKPGDPLPAPSFKK